MWLGVVLLGTWFLISVLLRAHESYIVADKFNDDCRRIVERVRPVILDRAGYDMEYVVEGGGCCGYWNSYFHSHNPTQQHHQKDISIVTSTTNADDSTDNNIEGYYALA